MSNISVGKLLFTLPVANQLGEGVQWHSDSQSIWWTDIEKSVLISYCVNTQTTTHYPMPDRVGCFAFIANDPRLIIAFAKGIALYDLASKKLQWLAQPEKNIENNRFNDGRVDRQGRFWAGTMVENEVVQSQQGGLYSYNHYQGIGKILSNIQISNSLCWSLNSLVMYHADSSSGVIYQYSFDPDSGCVSNKKLFAETQTGSVPDGATVDAEGGVWVAQWGGGSVVRYNAQAKVSLVHHLPISQPTCIAIGGPAMDWLIVTSAKHNLSVEKLNKQPLSGSLFVYQLSGIKGIPESKYIIEE
ncbi:MAG: SMP-30/gluconolactonase/LRE family protein [Colwellia sp.]